MSESVVHLVRHGQVHNPTGVLYGRLPGYGLSAIGKQMADRLGEYFAHADLVHLRSSPLQRAQETIAPISARHPHLDVVTDHRVIEAANVFEGKAVGLNPRFALQPAHWWHMRNPTVPSWGEPYHEIVARMNRAILDAADVAQGGDALILSHQLPIWMARLSAQGRPLIHDPRRRECTLASVTSFTVRDGRIVKVDYDEPARDLLPPKVKGFRPGA